MNEPTSAELYNIGLAVKQCANMHEPEAKLLGNVSAKELLEVMRDYTRLRLREGISNE